MTKRRAFLKQAGSLAALSMVPAGKLMASQGTAPGEGGELERIVPQRLHKGDLVGLVTPGSSVNAEQLEAAVEKIESLGLRTTYEHSVLDQYGYFAGKDEDRAAELMEMFSRKDIKGIWCVRGGYGSVRILDMLDYGVIRANPKVFIGYSDITALITSFYQMAGLVAYHGPVGTSDFNRFAVRSMERVIMEPKGGYKFPYRREKDTRDNPEFDRYTLSGGKAEGLLVGGNISVLDSMIGTAFAPDFEGKIAYLEDIGEKTYRLDKMVHHLLSGTNLKKAAGIVMGVMVGGEENSEPALGLKTALDDLLKPLGIPVSYGLSFGHIARQFTLPTGIRAEFNADKNSLRLQEPGVS